MSKPLAFLMSAFSAYSAWSFLDFYSPFASFFISMVSFFFVLLCVRYLSYSAIEYKAFFYVFCIIFLSCDFKFFLLGLDWLHDSILGLKKISEMNFDTDVYERVFFLTIAFKLSLLLSLFLVRCVKVKRKTCFSFKSKGTASKYNVSYLIAALLIISFFLSLLSFLLQIHFEIGFLGKNLPYKLSAIIIYSRSLLIPSIILLCALLTLRSLSVNSKMFTFASFLLFAHSLSMSLIMTSKGYVLIYCVMLTMVTIVEGGKSIWFCLRKFWYFYASTIILFPLMKVYRYLYVTNGYDHLLAIQDFQDLLYGFSSIPLSSSDSSVLFSVVFLLLRFIGVDSLLYLVDYIKDVDVADLYEWVSIFLNDQRSLSVIFTADVMGYDSSVHRTSPGIIAALYYTVPSFVPFFFLSLLFNFSIFLAVKVAFLRRTSFFGLRAAFTFLLVAFIYVEGSVALVIPFFVFSLVTIILDRFFSKVNFGG